MPIKKLPDTENQQCGDYYDMMREENEKDIIIREDGLPTVSDLKKIFGKEKKEDDNKGNALDRVVDSTKPMLDKVDGRHEDVVQFLEGILKLLR